MEGLESLAHWRMCQRLRTGGEKGVGGWPEEEYISERGKIPAAGGCKRQALAVEPLQDFPRKATLLRFNAIVAVVNVLDATVATPRVTPECSSEIRDEICRKLRASRDLWRSAIRGAIKPGGKSVHIWR